MLNKNILFLTLRTFSATGGIEKVCRIMGKALYEYAMETNGTVEICSMYDKKEEADDNPYFPAICFSGFAIKKLSFIKAMVKKGKGKDVVILSHINLVMIGWIIKKVSPKTKVVLLAHGIEIWESFSGYRRKMLNCCDEIISVSSFTRNKIIAVHQLSEQKCSVLNNCLDPFLPFPSIFIRNRQLLDKYGFNEDDKILMTLTRLSSKERYKGYDQVIKAIANLKPGKSNVKYLIAGSYDVDEKRYVEEQIDALNIRDAVIMTGFIKDSDLEAHFALADMYIMPSRKEGFGIVFIEAMYYGLPVIAGNMDGSVDALLNGHLGLLVDPQNVEEITAAISKILEADTLYTPDKKLLIGNFSYPAYKKNLHNILERV